MRRTLAFTLLLLAAAAAPARADETIAQLADPAPVDARGGRLVWSEKLPGATRYRLMTREGAQPAEAVPVPSRAEPFDVDLGPGADGATVASYSRGGALYVFDFATGRERSLDTPGRLPAVWRDRIAFVRGGRLYVRPLAGGAARELRGGRGRYEQIDLRGGRVAFARSRRGGDRTEYQLLVGRGGHVARLVDRAASGLLSSVAIRKPRLVKGAVVYALSRYGAAGNRFFRVTLPGGRAREAVSRQGIVAAAFDAGRFLYVKSDFPPGEGCGDTTCPLALTDPVSFR